jgi:hypothetical protein
MFGTPTVFALARWSVRDNQSSISGAASANLPRQMCQREKVTPGFWNKCQNLGSRVGFKANGLFNTPFCVNQYTKPLTDAKTHASSLTSHLLSAGETKVLVHGIALGDTKYLNPLMLALDKTCHHSGKASAKIAPASSTRLGVAELNNLRNIWLLGFA